MEEGGKELGRLVIAVVVVVALIAIAVAIFKGDAFKTKINNELNKVTSETSYVMPAVDYQLADSEIYFNA